MQPARQQLFFEDIHCSGSEEDAGFAGHLEDFAAGQKVLECRFSLFAGYAGTEYDLFETDAGKQRLGDDQSTGAQMLGCIK